MRNTCKTCGAFNALNRSIGECRSRSPMPILLGHVQPPSGMGQSQPIVQGFFPPVRDDIWCGEWRPRLQSVPAPNGIVSLAKGQDHEQ